MGKPRYEATLVTYKIFGYRPYPCDHVIHFRMAKAYECPLDAVCTGVQKGFGAGPRIEAIFCIWMLN